MATTSNHGCPLPLQPGGFAVVAEIMLYAELRIPDETRETSAGFLGILETSWLTQLFSPSSGPLLICVVAQPPIHSRQWQHVLQPVRGRPSRKFRVFRWLIAPNPFLLI